jgi:hypothetical protein
VSDGPTRNLVIVHTPLSQDLSDWLTVKEKITVRAPDIEVRIVNNVLPFTEAGRWQTTRPSLVFSPLHLINFKPSGGTVYAGRQLDKFIEARRLAKAGVPVPKTTRLVPGLKLRPETWGEYVIVKPSGEGSSLGRGVRLVRTDEIDVLSRRLAATERLIVQTYVDATDELGRQYDFRVMTIFGRPIMSQRRTRDQPLAPLAEIASRPDGIVASNDESLHRERSAEIDDEALRLAERVAAAIPEIPCLALDVVREKSTGQLFVLETNSGGNTWHFSSAAAQAHYTPLFRRQLYAQFSVLDVTADVLIERTRAEAR